METFMTTSDRTVASERTTAPDRPDQPSAIRSYLGSRWLLIGMATIAVAGGLALNWSWLVAAGIAPILLSVLPCLVMCGFGLCAHKLVGRSGASRHSNPGSGAAGCCADEHVAADQLRKPR
jgi:hypothetical protein